MATNDYSAVFIIYNPNSTSGSAEQKARRLAARLQKMHVKHVHLEATRYAGHAEELAYHAATRQTQPLIVSVSGDGGFNEVINGVMRVKQENPHIQAVCALLAAGNANDYHRTTHKQPLLKAIKTGTPETVDVLRLTTTSGRTKLIRYAHSYIGLGLTSEAAAELNRQRLTSIKELAIVWRTFWHFQPFTIQRPGLPAQSLDSLVFANIHQMSKIMRLGQKTDLHNGLFKVIAITHRHRLRLLYTLLSIAIRGFKHPPQRTAFSFSLPLTQLAHLDGEVIKIPGGSKVRAEVLKEALRIIR